jgi:hypothetical protein
MKKLLHIMAAAVLGVSLTTGFAAAQSGDIDTTGPDSSNTITHNDSLDVEVDNETDIRVTNNNPQRAHSGDARVHRNTNGGDAHTGRAMNESDILVEAMVDNSGSSRWATGGRNGGGSGGGNGGSIDTTGPGSDNRVTSNKNTTVDVENDTNIHVTNNNEQTATSGDAHVSNNTNGGSARSGEAHNSSVSTFVFEVHN